MGMHPLAVSIARISAASGAEDVHSAKHPFGDGAAAAVEPGNTALAAAAAAATAACTAAASKEPTDPVCKLRHLWKRLGMPDTGSMPIPIEPDRVVCM